MADESVFRIERIDYLQQYKVLFFHSFNGFMLVTYCFLISTAKVQPFSLFKTLTLTLLIKPRNQYYFMLVIPTATLPRASALMTTLLRWRKSPLLGRNLSLFELQIILFSKNFSADPTHKRSDGEPLFPSQTPPYS